MTLDRRHDTYALEDKAVDWDTFDRALLRSPASRDEAGKASELTHDSLLLGWGIFGGALVGPSAAVTALATHHRELGYGLMAGTLGGAAVAMTAELWVLYEAHGHLDHAIELYNERAEASGTCPAD